MITVIAPGREEQPASRRGRALGNRVTRAAVGEIVTHPAGWPSAMTAAHIASGVHDAADKS
jgi:hypothetical protein